MKHWMLFFLTLYMASSVGCNMTPPASSTATVQSLEPTPTNWAPPTATAKPMPIPTDTPRPALLSTPTRDDLERALVSQMHGEPNAQCEWQVVEQAQQEIYLWVMCQSDDSGVFAPAIVHVGPDGHVQRVDMLRPEAQLLLPPDVRKRILAAELDMSAMLTRLAACRAKLSTPPVPTPSLRIPPPPGLVYVAEPKLWKIGRDGKPAQIFDYFDNLSALSPDGKQVLYISDGLWLADLATGNRRKLVQSAHRPEYPRWWPARPDVIVLGSVPPDFAGAPEGWSPALVRIDGQGFRVLDPKSLSDSVPVPGPDGQTIAYERDGQPWLYRWGKGSEPLNPAHYGLTNTMELGFTRPAWSPDGKRLAWVTESLVDGLPERNGIAIFNLDAKTARLVHPDKPMIALELLPMDVPAWSPDGRWIAVTGFLKGQEQDSLWIVRADAPTEQVYHQDGGTPIWSPDSQQLAFARSEAGSPVWITQVGTRRAEPVDLSPVDFQWLVAWLP